MTKTSIDSESNVYTQIDYINVHKILDYIMGTLTAFFNFIEEKPMKLSSSKIDIKKISISDTISSIKSEDHENSDSNSYKEISNSDIFISKK